MRDSLLYVYGLVLLAVAAVPVQAITVSRDFAGNECSGCFGTGFDSCTVFINDNGQRIELSPVIAKYDQNLVPDEANGTVYPSIDGTEFSFSGAMSEWTCTPGLDDPGVRFRATRAGNDFTLFWDVDAAALAPGGACDVTDTYKLPCLNAALTVLGGSWTTPGGKSLSHITFYDSAPPDAVPLPAAVWLIGLAGAVRQIRKN